MWPCAFLTRSCLGRQCRCSRGVGIVMLIQLGGIETLLCLVMGFEKQAIRDNFRGYIMTLPPSSLASHNH